MKQSKAEASLSSSRFTIVTELSGDEITDEALRMLYTRYEIAGRSCVNKHVLEMACGAGLGLGYLGRRARSLVGGDYNFTLLRDVYLRCNKNVPLLCFDAHQLPFRAEVFDVILLYEAIYYLRQPEQCIRECRRALKPNGTLLVCLANRDWPGFNPSPFSTSYFSADELRDLLERCGFEVQVYGAFLNTPNTFGRKIRVAIRHLAAKSHLIPKTLRAKAKLKRIFYGQLRTIGESIEDGACETDSLVPLSPGTVCKDYRILYALGRAA